MQKILGQVRRCVEDYHMIDAGDVVAVGVSGGKDSLVTLTALARLRAFYPIPFTVRAITLETGAPGMSFDAVADLCRQLEVPYTRIQVPVYDIVFNERKEKNPCSLCAKLRRGSLSTALTDLGIRKIALGHHYDDAVATALMSLFYGGQFKTMMPKVKSDNWAGMELIRPLFLVREEHIIAWQHEQGLECLRCACRVTSSEDGGKRKYIRDLIEKLSVDNPKLKNNIFAALSAVDLDTVLGYRAVGADSITPFTQDYAAPQRQEPEVKA